MGTKGELGRIEVLDHLGRPVRLGTLWRDQPVVAGFVRHFGCIFCHEQVADLGRVRSRLERAGARVVIVGSGTPHQANLFMQRTGTPRDVFTDAARLAFRALGMHHGVSTTLGLRPLRASIRATRRGHRQLDIQGDRWQQGGTVIITRSGRVDFVHRALFAGDATPIDSVLRAVDSLDTRP